MYCGMASIHDKEERKVYFGTVVEAINGRASHWANGNQRTNFNTDDVETFWKSSDFILPIVEATENASL
uniref:Endonuclease n=1 Tax=Strongyloides papillosus TaxID=174720 RepID=A0A0N5BLP7_STREA